MTRSLASRFTTTALIVAALATSTGVFAYGSAAPMSVTAIEAQAPVASLSATTTAPAEPRVQAAPATPAPAPRLHRWIAALRQRISGATEVAQR